MATNAEHQKAWRERRKKELAELRKGGGGAEGDGAGELAKAREEIGRLRKELAAVALRKEQAPQAPDALPQAGWTPGQSKVQAVFTYTKAGAGADDFTAKNIVDWLTQELMADHITPRALDLMAYNAKWLACKWWSHGGRKRAKKPLSDQDARHQQQANIEERIQAEFRSRMDDVWKLVKEKEADAEMILERDRVRDGRGLMTKAEFMKIMKCLHSDRLNGIDKAELDEAFRLFMGFKAKLIKIEPADDGRLRPPPLPKTAEEWRNQHPRGRDWSKRH